MHENWEKGNTDPTNHVRRSSCKENGSLGTGSFARELEKERNRGKERWERERERERGGGGRERGGMRIKGLRENSGTRGAQMKQ